MDRASILPWRSPSSRPRLYSSSPTFFASPACLLRAACLRATPAAAKPPSRERESERAERETIFPFATSEVKREERYLAALRGLQEQEGVLGSLGLLHRRLQLFLRRLVRLRALPVLPAARARTARDLSASRVRVRCGFGLLHTSSDPRLIVSFFSVRCASFSSSSPPSVSSHPPPSHPPPLARTDSFKAAILAGIHATQPEQPSILAGIQATQPEYQLLFDRKRPDSPLPSRLQSPRTAPPLSAPPYTISLPDIPEPYAMSLQDTRVGQLSPYAM